MDSLKGSALKPVIVQAKLEAPQCRQIVDADESSDVMAWHGLDTLAWAWLLRAQA